MLAGLIAIVGILIGWIAGTALARALAYQYAQFFEFPYVIFRVSYWVYAAAALAAVVTTCLGAIQSALKAARLAPAVAMQPPAPPRFKRSVIDRALTHLRLSQSTTMILRSLFRWPLRSFLSALGLGLAVSSVIAAMFMNDALDDIVDLAFYQSNRQDAIFLFTADTPESTLENIRALDGVLQAEGQQFHTVALRNKHFSKRVAIEARPPGTDLSRVVDAHGETLTAPPGGILLSAQLAAHLRVQAGDQVTAEFLGGKRETFTLTVTGLAEQYLGLGAYMDLAYLNALFRQTPQLSTVNVTLDSLKTEALHDTIKNIPGLAGIVELTENRRSFEKTIAQNVVVMNAVYIIISVLITVGVAYNAARIQLSERARELASLRILGFSKADVSYILVGEMMLLALLAQPIGWLVGAWIAQAMTNAFSSDLYSIPLVLKPATFTTASLVVLGAALASVLVVRRRLDRLNLVAVMKTRE